jgi:hypothetical protein
MDWNACNPLRFLKLFRGKAMTLLTVARGLQEAPEFISIYDINFAFFNRSLPRGSSPGASLHNGCCAARCLRWPRAPQRAWLGASADRGLYLLLRRHAGTLRPVRPNPLTQSPKFRYF